LSFSLDGSEPQHKTFWSMDDVVAAGRADPFEGNDVAAADTLEQLLGDAVGRRMIADVPLGAFLSGGIDSSAVVALMQARSAEPVRTFSIGFHEQGFNEAEHARQVAAYLGTRHTELYVSSEEALGVVPRLAAMFDEPFADSSQIPTYLISAMTRREVTVALSGDGGDEVFAGYTRHQHARLLERLLSATPVSLRRGAARAIRTAPPSFWDAVGRALSSGRRVTQAGDKMHKLADVLSQDRSALYRRLISHWDRPNDVVIGGTEPRGLVFDPDVAGRLSEPTERMQYLDTLTYLPDDILTKVDRASMAVSLEARVPLLDHRVVEFAWRLPLRFKLRAGKSKWLLRQVLYRHVPPHL
ncbi:MAG: asparagine synthase C-terminal domain-containing protein, partial [Rhodospirillaceae bacterium]|nr:asparagine synthase C-terminal domain-containing protein [Rhodospirillaceae bacterium]